MTCPITYRLSPKISLAFSLQPVLLSVFSPSSFFFSFSQRSLFSLNLHYSSTSHHHHTSRRHHKQPPQATVRSVQAQPRSGIRSLSLSLSSLCQTDFSLSHFFSLSSLLPDRFISVSNFVIWAFDLRILSLGLLCLWFGFLVNLCVGGFGFLVVVGKA